MGLIWLVDVSGINGYMLPWDRLAQFVIVGTFEWLDWLPTFGGALIRNFIYPSSVNDRLFSLLSFIQLGVLAMLLALSLLMPVTSQGGAADLSTEIASLALDLFVLPIYPILYLWHPGAFWLLIGVGTLALAAMPRSGRRRCAAQLRSRTWKSTSRSRAWTRTARRRWASSRDGSSRSSDSAIRSSG